MKCLREKRIKKSRGNLTFLNKVLEIKNGMRKCFTGNRFCGWILLEFVSFGILSYDNKIAQKNEQ